MKITLICHASVIIETSDTVIWTDPWLFGKAFNDSWSLLPEAKFDTALYDKIKYVWVSHEHPDHFHIPTLKSLPKEFKERVILLFQKNNSDKMPNAFRKLGFTNITLMPNRKIFSISPRTKVYNFQIGQMDSSLAVINEGETVLDLNDCEANSKDCAILKKDLGKIKIVLNQFSMAGYNGHIDYHNHLPKQAKTILKNVVENHADLGAEITIPFASFIYFSNEDNKYMNGFANTVHDTYRALEESGKKCAVLYPGDTLDSNKPYDSKPALEKFDQLYKNLDALTYDKSEIIEFEKLKEAFVKRYIQLKAKYPQWVLNKLKPVVIKVPDLNIKINLALCNGTFEKSEQDEDLIINSQPLFLSFDQPFGVQTLGVSARYGIKSKYDIWKKYRIITSLNNAEIYLKPRYIFTKNNFQFLASRMKGGLNQLTYQLKRMNS